MGLLPLIAVMVLLCGCDPTPGPVGDPPHYDGGTHDLETPQRDMYRCAGIMCPSENGSDVLACVDVRTDPRNCGACGVKGNSNLPDCCDGEIVNKGSNDFHCGACGHVCDAQAGLTCLAGICARPMGIN